MLSIDLKGKTALITGVTSGIGFGIAKIFARAGCTITGCANFKENTEDAKNFSEMLVMEGAKGHYSYCDVTNINQMTATVEATVKKYGGIDILISNAGTNVFEGADHCSEKQWDFNADLNLKSHWQLSLLCKPWLEKSKNGVILIMTSNHSEATIPGCFPYNVTKTALKGLVQSLAIEWGPKIRTIGIAPGFIDTEGNQKWFDSFPDPTAERSRTISLHPVKKLGTTEDIGTFCAFLASDMACFISGTTYLIDGGRSALLQD